MQRPRIRFLWMPSILLLLCARPASADVIEFDDNEDDWVDAVGDFTTIDFTGFPEFTWITDQYAHLGAHFVDGADLIQESDLLYLEDGWGIDGNTEVRIEFDGPINYFAVEGPGDILIRLFANGELVYSSSPLGGSGPGRFGGIVADEPFDEVQVLDALFPGGGNVNIDNLYFGPPIPAPGALMLLGLGALMPARWRRA